MPNQPRDDKCIKCGALARLFEWNGVKYCAKCATETVQNYIDNLFEKK